MPSWGDRDEIAGLNRMTIHELYSYLGQPEAVLRYYQQPRPSWEPGLDRPECVSENPDPVVVSAMGRCAFHRLRHGLPVAVSWVHPTPCGWCSIPLRKPRTPHEAGDDGLLAALDYAIWKARLIVEERFVWHKGERGTPDYDVTYTRTGRSNVYEHPAFAAFAALPAAQQRYRVDQAVARSMGPE